jgi:ABC-type proline/glycine betaine transport system permease subunit
LQNFFHWYILQSWNLKRPQILLSPHHFWTYTSNLTTVVKSVLKFMINGMTSILRSYIFQICAAIYQLLLHIVFTSRNWFVMQGPVAIILISWNVIFIWETGYWTRAIKWFALFDLLKSLYSDTKILSIYIPSMQKRL